MLNSRQSASFTLSLLLGFLLAACFSRIVYAQAAPGVLPWALPESGAAAGPRKQKKAHAGRKSKRSNRNNRRSARGQQPGGSPVVPFQFLTGNAYFGFQSVGAGQLGASTRTNERDLGFNLQTQGFLLDPRLWSHALSLQLDRSGIDSPFQSTATAGLGVNFTGTLFGNRSFPFRVLFNRHQVNTSFQGPADITTNYRNLGVAWSLHKPEIAEIGISALFGNTSNDTISAFLPFHEREQTYDANVSRSLLGWNLFAAADYSHVQSSLNDFQYILRTQEVRADRRIGERGQFLAALHRILRNDSDRNRPSTRYDLTNFQSMLTHRHTERIRGSYSFAYLSNVREAFISSALQGAVGGGTPPPQPNPELRQALGFQSETSSINGQAGWDVQLTPNLSVGGSVLQTILHTPGVPVQNFGLVLDRYTGLGGNAAYRRRLGKWDMNWRGNVLRTFNHPLQGRSYADNSRSLGFGAARPLANWRWTSDILYFQYDSQRGLGTLHRDLHWNNAFETRFWRSYILNLRAEVFDIDSNFASFNQSTTSAEKGLLLNGTLSSRRWTASIAQGLRNVNSAVLFLDLSNPLGTIVLSRVTPLVTPLNSADRYLVLTGSYRARRTLTFQGMFRRDSFRLASGDFNRYTDLDLSANYRLRIVTVTCGYQRFQQDVAAAHVNRDRVYVRLGRPFRIF